MPGETWPDYGRFDCWSCHHDLKRDGWRQARGYRDGPPGRVPVSEWPLALVELGIERLALANNPQVKELREGLQAHEQALFEKATARPFGQKDSIGAAANAYANWTKTLIEELNQIQASDKRRRLEAAPLCSLEKAKDIDPRLRLGVRHVGWTYQAPGRGHRIASALKGRWPMSSPSWTSSTRL